MTKFKLLSSVLTLSFAMLFTACSKDEEQILEEKVAIEIVNKIEVICHRGFLNEDDTKSFAADGQPVGSPYLRKNTLVFQRENSNDWVLTNVNGKEKTTASTSVLSISGSGEHEYESISHAFEFIYYNAKGERINATFFNDSKAYQTFFSINEFTDNTSETIETVTDGGKNIFEYVYRDTNPENEMFQPFADDVKLTNSNLGLKGYLEFKKSKISFDFNVTFVKFKEGYEKKSSHIFTDISQEDIDEKITITIPVNIFTKTGYSDEAFNQYIKDVAEHFNISEEKSLELEGWDAQTEAINYNM